MQMLGEQTLTAKIATPGSRTAGVWTPGTPTNLTFKGVIQPLTDRELQQLPEGWRTRARWKLYTRTALKPLNVQTGTAGDRVVFGGLDLLVFGRRDYVNTPKDMRLYHFKFILVEPERTET